MCIRRAFPMCKLTKLDEVYHSLKMLNIKQIMEIIPHRYPFLLIDKIEDYTPGQKAIAIKNVTMNEYFFQGHFPKEPIMPGVLIIEALAQTGAVSILSLPEFRGKVAMFAGINNLKFKRPVIPGDTLKLEVEIIKRKGPIGIGKATATVNGGLAVSGELTFAIK